MQSFSSLQGCGPLKKSKLQARMTQQKARAAKPASAKNALFTIKEEKNAAEPAPDAPEPTPGLSELRRQCSALQAQRDEAYAELEAALAATTVTDAHRHIQENTLLKSQLAELECRNQTLQERCKTLAAWAEQHRSANLKLEAQHQESREELRRLQAQHQEALNASAGQGGARDAFTCESLADALANADRMHVSLEREHAKLQQDKAALESRCAFLEGKAQSAISDLAAARADLGTCREALSASRNRACDAERRLQGLVGLHALLSSAPVSAHLSRKASSVLQSSVDVLALAQRAPPDELPGCLEQVLSALARLDDEVAEHAASSRAWLAKRDILLQPQPQVDG